MPSILIVDDHDQVRALLAKWFEGSGYAVRSAKGGYQAIEQLRQSPADVLLLDLNMPAGHGLETIRHLRCEFPRTTTRIILMSGCGPQQRPEDIEETGLLAGAHATVCKPFDLPHLLRRVEEQRQLARFTCSQTYYLQAEIVHWC